MKSEEFLCNYIGTAKQVFQPTAIIILISVRRSTQQISRAYAVRSMVAIVDIFDIVYFVSNDLITRLPKFSLKIFPNDPDVVPIGRPLLSSSSNVLISL